MRGNPRTVAFEDLEWETRHRLGDPRQHPGIAQIKDALCDGDYVFISRIRTHPPVIYFMRPLEQNPYWQNFVAAFDGDVLGADMIIDPRKRDNPEGVLRCWVEERFDLVYYQGREMDGFFEPFFVLRSKSS